MTRSQSDHPPSSNQKHFYVLQPTTRRLFTDFFFFFLTTGCPKAVQLLQLKLACRTRRTLFFYLRSSIFQPSTGATSLRSGGARTHQRPHSSRRTAIRFERHQVLPAGRPDIDEWSRSGLPLQSRAEEASAHILHRIILGYLPLLSARTIISLFPSSLNKHPWEFTLWQKKN